MIVLTAGTYGNVVRLLPPITIDDGAARRRARRARRGDRGRHRLTSRLAADRLLPVAGCRLRPSSDGVRRRCDALASAAPSSLDLTPAPRLPRLPAAVDRGVRLRLGYAVRARRDLRPGLRAHGVARRGRADGPLGTRRRSSRARWSARSFIDATDRRSILAVDPGRPRARGRESCSPARSSGHPPLVADLRRERPHGVRGGDRRSRRVGDDAPTGRHRADAASARSP